ncbi:MAG: tyrosine-type recombinase/integrase [Streptosporangiaceae bacterium]
MAPDLAGLLASWRRHLEAERKSPHTIKTYTDGVTAFLAWCDQEGRPRLLDEDTVVDWVNSIHAAGRSGSTAVARQAAVRRFSKWLARKGHIDADRLRDLDKPKLDEPAIVAVTDDQLRALLGTCKGTAFHHVRDRAAITFMFETGVRAAELTGMTTADVNLDARLAVIRGKGGRGRLVRFSPQCNAALDDYVHLRRRHRLAPGTAFWLGGDGRGFGYYGLYNAIQRRGARIGLPDLHPHQLRSTSAVRWLRKGGSATGLMAQAGWASVDMLRRYIRAAESELAAEEADRLGLGDI